LHSYKSSELSQKMQQYEIYLGNDYNNEHNNELHILVDYIHSNQRSDMNVLVVFQ
jgi:hypothetical protein